MRKGAPKAIMALAHHLITVVYRLLAGGEEYVELGADYFDHRNKPKTVSRLVQRLMRLGYYVTLDPIPVEADDDLPPSSSETPPGDPNLFSDELPPSPPIPGKRRGRPCKCAERGITCKHGRHPDPKILANKAQPAVRFS